MAPRRRPLKKGERRMDAALDAMTPYGFPNKLVRQTVDQLLKVYGGTDGWVFIEDSAYTLLINTLLEQQQDDHNQDYMIEDKPGNGPNEAGCSSRALLPCSNIEASDDAPLTNQAVDTISAASATSVTPTLLIEGVSTGNQLVMAVDNATATSKTVNELPIMPVDTSAAISQPNNQLPMSVDIATATRKTVNELPLKPVYTSAATNQPSNQLKAVDTATATSKTVNQLRIKPVDTSAATSQPSNQPSIKAVDTVSATNEIDHKVPIKAIIGTGSAEPPQTKSLQPMGRLCHKRRRPCHGWISSDDDEDVEEDLIELSALYKIMKNGVKTEQDITCK